jgi:preprotein translocase subunit SecD
MKSSSRSFNLIFALFLLLAVAGCQSGEKFDKEKQPAVLRFHLETNPDGTHHNSPVEVYRAHPFVVNVERDPALDEGFIKDVQVVDVDDHGGFGIKVIFDESGRRRLQDVTVANKGKHLAIMAEWTETRWLAAPLITKNISNGIFIFTPDATREESEAIVRGVKHAIKEFQEPYVF